MRRKDREIRNFDAICGIIEKCRVLRLGLADGDLFPYIVPVNFGYEAGGEEICFYIHGAMAGRKYELMRRNGVCSFEMDCGHATHVDEEEKEATMHYQSVMGKACIEFLEDEEKIRGLGLIMAREECTRDMDYSRVHVPRTAVVRLRVTEIVGKSNPAMK